MPTIDPSSITAAYPKGCAAFLFVFEKKKQVTLPEKRVRGVKKSTDVVQLKKSPNSLEYGKKTHNLPDVAMKMKKL